MLSIVIPVYNEEEIINSTLTSVFSYLESNDIDNEVIVIDDGSKDQSRELINEFPVKINPNRKQKGKGFSVREGVKMAKGDKILMMDADLSTPLKYIGTFLKLSKKNDIVIASRAMPESEANGSLASIVMGRIGNRLINLCCVDGITDTQCGFKLFSKDAARELFSKQLIDGFGFDFEVLMLAQDYGYSIKEVPVQWTDKGKSEIGTIEYLQTLTELIQIQINKLRNKY